uniref:Uncharacterized protein n=1 Tax=Aotus nancymaae TaxID=37293 RepID=A0A2K5D5J5_AOTNA
MKEACRDKEAEPPVSVNTLCPGTPSLLVGLFSSSPVLLFVLDVKRCEWLTFYRQDPHTEKSEHFFQLSCLCRKLLGIGVCLHGNFSTFQKVNLLALFSVNTRAETWDYRSEVWSSTIPTPCDLAWLWSDLG